MHSDSYKKIITELEIELTKFDKFEEDRENIYLKISERLEINKNFVVDAAGKYVKQLMNKANILQELKAGRVSSSS